jgi:hypothetical protein
MIYNATIMRWQAIIVLLAITLSVFVPPSLSLTGSCGQAAIGTLDVCHSAIPALSSNGEMPCMNECSNAHLPLGLQEIIHIVSLPDKSVFIAFQDERPPKH